MNHLMIDLETLSTQPNAAICAIGAVFFEPSNGSLGKRFYQTIDPRSSEKRGAHVSADTALWWLEQDIKVRSEVLDATASELDALLRFHDFITEVAPEEKMKDLNVWCKGGSFDFPVLRSAFDRYYCSYVPPIPWGYWNENCLRSCLTLAAATGYVPHERTTTRHNALADAEYQAEQVCEIWQRLTRPSTDRE